MPNYFGESELSLTTVEFVWKSKRKRSTSARSDRWRSARDCRPLFLFANVSFVRCSCAPSAITFPQPVSVQFSLKLIQASARYIQKHRIGKNTVSKLFRCLQWSLWLPQLYGQSVALSNGQIGTPQEFRLYLSFSNLVFQVVGKLTFLVLQKSLQPLPCFEEIRNLPSKDMQQAFTRHLIPIPAYLWHLQASILQPQFLHRNSSDSSSRFLDQNVSSWRIYSYSSLSKSQQFHFPLFAQVTILMFWNCTSEETSVLFQRVSSSISNEEMTVFFLPKP